MSDEYRDEELRDHIAALAMSGLLMNGNSKIAFEDPSSPARVAKRSYEFADAMLQFRQKKP